MATPTEKSFASIQTDYAFFEEHTSERSRCLQSWHPHLQGLSTLRPSLRMLDFGCGSGSFTREVLAQLCRLTGARPPKIRLTLLEPVAEALSQAQAACQAQLQQPVLSLTRLQALPAWARFDLIVSHHVLYYVDPLQPTLRELLARLRPGGRALLVVSGESSIGQLQSSILGRAGIETPYHSGQIVLQTLERLAPVGVETFPSELRMPDTVSNRQRILNFLVGEFGHRIDWACAMEAFDPFVNRGEIVMPNQEMNLVVEGERAFRTQRQTA